MRHLKEVLYISLLVFFFSVLGIFSASAATTYQVTDSELTELSTIFEQLDSRQKQQKALLAQQAEQLTTLREQLEISQKQINISQTEMQKLQTSLDTANQSLKESAAEAKRKNDRLERQRDMWAIASILVLGIVIAE